MKIDIILYGGLEVLFSGISKFDVNVEEGANMAKLIEEIKTSHLKEREELFVQENSVRPGIIVMINDVDWELLDTIEY